jgi:hypothetical protein
MFPPGRITNVHSNDHNSTTSILATQASKSAMEGHWARDNITQLRPVVLGEIRANNSVMQIGWNVSLIPFL